MVYYEKQEEKENNIDEAMEDLNSFETLSSKKSDIYETPYWLMNLFKDFYDPCPIDPQEDGLKRDWKSKTYVNPPYSKPLPWIEKAIEESKKGKYIVMLLKLDCSTKWFRRLVEAKAHIIFVNERVKFNGKPPLFSSMIAILAGEDLK